MISMFSHTYSPVADLDPTPPYDGGGECEFCGNPSGVNPVWSVTGTRFRLCNWCTNHNFNADPEWQEEEWSYQAYEIGAMESWEARVALACS